MATPTRPELQQDRPLHPLDLGPRRLWIVVIGFG
jgi:hypothetical protein